MNTLGMVGDLLPQAVAIAISPLPIIAVVVMLLAPRARPLAFAFLGGWIVGVATVLAVAALLSAIVPATDPDATHSVVAVVKILLGATLLFLVFRRAYRSRHGSAEDRRRTPKWLTALDKLSPGRGFGIAVLLAAVNPKNLVIGVGAGITVGTSGAELSAQLAAAIVYVVLASLSVAMPVVAFAVVGERAGNMLRVLRDWLSAHSAAIVSTLMLIGGVMLLGKGIAAL